MKLEINHKKKTEKHTKSWRINKSLLNRDWFNNEVKEEIKRYLETKMRTKQPKNLWDTVKAALRKIHRITGQPQETRKISNKLN